jgi:CHASE3 domain sensor protein
MNLSFKIRIASSFGLANVMVLIIGFTVFYYLNSLNDQIEDITSNTNQVSLLTDEIRISAVSILKMQRKRI